MFANIKLCLTSLAVFIFQLFIIVAFSSAKTLQGKVVKVGDGDTLTIIDDRGFKYRVRLAGIDAPEKDQPHGKGSTKNLKWLVYDKGVTVEYSKLDRYGRIVGKVMFDSQGDMFCFAVDCVRNVDAGLEQVSAGIAWHYKRYQAEQHTKDRKLYSIAEREARKNKIGLWNDKNPTPPWKWRRDNRLEALRKRFNETKATEKTYAMALRMDPEQLKKYLDEAIWNAFKSSGLDEDEFVVEFDVSPEKLKSILENREDEK